jgi:hypothetical protein
MEDLMAWELLVVLDLSQEQSDRFLPVLRQMQKGKAQLRQQRRELLNHLERVLSEGEGPGEIDQTIKELRELGRQETAVREEFFGQAEDILTIQQLGKLVLFQDKFERHMREIIRELREDRMR